MKTVLKRRAESKLNTGSRKVKFTGKVKTKLRGRNQEEAPADDGIFDDTFDFTFE